jgi:Rps23 Pro-64 3,4-dihydroxylase Tpa1-like proline 4-hydroxylase
VFIYLQSEIFNINRYLHGVIEHLIQDELLRSVRKEIIEHLHFTPKETDIYKIHQSGDLANLDGLDDASLAKLPSLLSLRDALYSSNFRHWISKVAQSGPLSGKKTDMAINVYTPGCHLLCHDDVIGSRRLSYILYLTDPDIPWKAEWGGALRLYPTSVHKSTNGKEYDIPSPEFTVSIPPAWNQLSFFTIQPGQSFHDVEEVYHRSEGDQENDGGRIRMAISGWFHIPQEGEEGFEPGLEERLTKNSSLFQLEAEDNDLDLPKPKWKLLSSAENTTDGVPWTETKLEYLVKFINPNYLVPDTLEELSEEFAQASVVTIPDFLNPKFADKLGTYIQNLDKQDTNTALIPSPAEANSGVAIPPHKHRYLFRDSLLKEINTDQFGNPLDSLLDHFLPSDLFGRWTKFLTNLSLKSRSFLARRFRRGNDYTLATGYDKDSAQLEITLGLSPSPGWAADEDDEDEDDNEVDDATSQPKSKVNKDKVVPEANSNQPTIEHSEEDNVGGYEVYMAGDEMDEDETEHNDENGEASGKKQELDPAVYKTSGEDEDDIVFSMPASWNTLNIVLRDKGLLRFVKYVSHRAKGDRWDVTGMYEVQVDEDDDEDDDEVDDMDEDEDKN